MVGLRFGRFQRHSTRLSNAYVEGARKHALTLPSLTYSVQFFFFLFLVLSQSARVIRIQRRHVGVLRGGEGSGGVAVGAPRMRGSLARPRAWLVV